MALKVVILHSAKRRGPFLLLFGSLEGLLQEEFLRHKLTFSSKIFEYLSISLLIKCCRHAARHFIQTRYPEETREVRASGDEVKNIKNS